VNVLLDAAAGASGRKFPAPARSNFGRRAASLV
jgi:hypothetical protein